MSTGFSRKHERVIDRPLERSRPARRRITYHALADLACLGELTPYALDDALGESPDESGIRTRRTVTNTQHGRTSRGSPDRLFGALRVHTTERDATANRTSSA